jgi:hypothetical protein
LYYKPITIVNDDSRVINKLEASLADDARVIIYDRHMFMVQATESIHKYKSIGTQPLNKGRVLAAVEANLRPPFIAIQNVAS